MLLLVAPSKSLYCVFCAVYQKHLEHCQRPNNVGVSRNSDCATIHDVYVSVVAIGKVLV